MPRPLRYAVWPSKGTPNKQNVIYSLDYLLPFQMENKDLPYFLDYEPLAAFLRISSQIRGRFCMNKR